MDRIERFEESRDVSSGRATIRELLELLVGASALANVLLGRQVALWGRGDSRRLRSHARFAGWAVAGREDDEE
ncbi:hypothetical protein [Natrinema caseinilyticum]|uniref:hypothetical protein n=1 Tax=Natrinema caseinilyticum TaxID=2961570 RepID=UPI0030F4723C